MLRTRMEKIKVDGRKTEEARRERGRYKAGGRNEGKEEGHMVEVRREEGRVRR